MTPTVRALLLPVLWGMVASAAGLDAPERADARARPEVLRAVRLHGPVTLDGRLDEPAWATAPVFSGFVENFPKEGAVPDQRTEVRILYDDSHLYVGVIAFDAHPELITRQLGRRDAETQSDRVAIGLDPTLSHRTGYMFSVTASGVLQDGLLYGDTSSEVAWDAVWDARVAPRTDGWSAEFVIPLNLLRFPRVPEQDWGFAVRREIARTHQIFYSFYLPREANALVSRFGHLQGLEDLKPRPDLEVTPYVAARAALAPRFADDRRPSPRLLNPSADVGVDLRSSLTSSLTLNAAVNPDFGQVEADQVILNLQNSEPFFPEKRPFFNQGLEIFQPVGAEFGAPHQLFYSRRIGLTAPILGAAKVTGSLSENWEVGALDGLVMGANNPLTGAYSYSNQSTDLAPADRGVRFQPSQPFHLGPTNDLPAERPVPTNYFALVARRRLLANSSVGVTVTSAAPLAERCYPADFPEGLRTPPAPSPSLYAYSRDLCAARGQNAVGVDWNLRSRDGKYYVLGIVDGSERLDRSGSGVTLADGTVLKGGDLGFGGYLRAGKFGGEPWHYSVQYQYASPKLDLNSVGYLPSQNQQKVGGALQYLRTSGIGSLQSLSSAVFYQSFFTTDGLGRSRGNYVSMDTNVQLPGFQTVGFNLFYEDPRLEVREVYQTGVPLQRQGDVGVAVYGSTDAKKPLYLEAGLFGFRLFGEGPAPWDAGFGTDFKVVWHPQSRLETQLEGHFARSPQGIRYVDTAGPAGEGASRYIFAAQHPGFLSLTLRQQLVLTPRMTLQAYAQLFSDYKRYGPSFYFADRSPGQAVMLEALQPTQYALNSSTYAQDGHSSVLNLNVVFRWEYRLGSTLYLVYTRSQRAPGLPDGAIPPANVLPYQLAQGPATDLFLVKWSYWWTV